MVSASSLLLTLDLENAIVPPLLTAAPTTPVTDAIALLGNPSTRHPVAANQDALNAPSSGCARCLVVMDDTQLVGLFSERDVTRLVANGRSPTGLLLEAVMQPPIVTIRQVELTTPDAALKLLRQHNIQHLPVLDDDGHVVGLLSGESLCRLLQPVEREQQLEPLIAELRLQAERSQLLMAVSARIRAALSLTETLNATVAEVRQFLGCDRVSIYRFNENQQFQVVAESLAANQRSFVSEVIHDPCFASDWATQHGNGRVVADIYAVGMTPCHIELLERLQIRAKILMPVIIDNGFWGLISASESAAPRPWQPSEVTFLEELATQVAIAIHQSQTASLLQQQRQELEMLLDRAPDIIFRLDRDLHYLYINAAVESMLGHAPEALIGQPSLVFTLAPEYLAEWMALTQQVAATGQEETIECQLQTRTHALWLQTRVAPEYSIDETVTSFLCVARNITQRKQAEAKQVAYINILLEWQNRHHAAQQASGQVLYEWDTTTDHLTWGINAEQVFGYSASEMPQASAAWFTRVHPEDLQWVQTAVTEYVEHRRHLHLRYRWQHQDGHYTWIEVQAQFFADVSGNLTRVIGYVTDISEKIRLEADRTQLEAALRESEAQLRQIFENSEDVFFLKSLDGEQMIYTSPAWEGLYQTPLQQTYDNPQVWLDFVHSADRDRMSKFHQQMCQGEIFEPCEYRIVRPDGSVRWLWTRTFLIRNETGEAYRVAGINTDITERKQMEMALRESEQTLSHVTNTMPGVVYKYRRSPNVVDVVDHFVFLSQGVVDLYELTAEEILNDVSIVWDIILPEDVEQTSASINQSAATLEPWKFEFRIRTTSGVLKWILGHSIPSQQEDGSIIWCGILTDISDRKRSEAALRESEQRYRDLAEAMPQMVWLADTTGSAHYFNQRWYDYTGLSEAESMGLNAAVAIHQDERDRTLQEWAQATTSGTLFEAEYRLRHYEGRYRWFIVRGLPIHNPAGDITSWVSTITDIDDFKRAILAQQQSEARFRAVFEQAAVGIAEVDTRGRFLRVNQCYCNLLGYGEAELLERDFQSLTPNASELELDLCLNQQLLASEIDSFTIEKRMLCKNGELRWCQVTVSPVFNISGTIAYCLAIVQDIQNRKLAELARQASEARLNDVLSSAGASIGHFRFYENGAWETEYHSNGSEQIFGYAPDDFLAETWLSGIAAEDWHAIYEPMLAAIKAETEITLEYRFYHVDGSTRWISDTVTSRWNEENCCWVVTAIGTDISDRKLAEQALQQLNHELEARIIQRTAALSESEMRYRTLFEQAAVGISQCHPSGTYFQVNQRFCDLTGYAQAELLKMSWRDLIHPDDLTANQSELTQLYQGESVSITAESRYIRKDGQPQWVSLTISLLYDGAGALISDLTVVEDISDRKKIEHRLQASEKRLREIISKTVDGILILNPHGQILFGNPAAEKIFDCQQPYCQGALLGIPITLEKTFELDIPHRNGSLCTVEVRVEEITWQDKKAFLAAVRDISQRKQDQIALQASESSYRTLAENLPGLVYKLYPSQNNKLVFFNDRLTTLYRLNPADLAQQNKVCPMSFLIVPEDHDRVIETIQAAITNQQPFQVEYGIHISTTQEKRYLLEQGRTAIDDIGQTLHIVGVIFDVTDTKRTEEELRKINEQLTITNAELARATRLKDEFLANMSHELRTPLNSVLGLSEVLQEKTYGDLTEQQQRALTTIQINGQHLLALINDILDLAKIESGKLELQMTPVSVQQLCQSTIPFIQQQAFRKQICFSLNLAFDLVYIEVDERLIRQALINLLINAVKFTPSGGSVTLTVEGNAEKQSLSFSVIDTGIGIAPENIDKLFQPFIQIDSSLSRRYSGTGLGLALVRRIVELHKGSVTVHSTMGQGSQFTVLLPWKHASSPDQAQILSDTVAAAETDAKSLPVETQNAVKKPIVLLVEDNLDNIETLTAYLDLKGFEIVVARNGLKATQLIQTQSFNLILMDIQMPDMDGLEAIRQIRSQDRHIPILAVTALAMRGDKENCLAAGADDYLTKPISPIHLVSTMKKYLQLP